MRTKRQTNLRILKHNGKIVGKERLLRYLLDNVVPENNNRFNARFLFKSFGSIENIYAMSNDEIESIPVLGEEVNEYLVATKVLYKRLKTQNKERNHLYHPELVIEKVQLAFLGKEHEHLYVYFVDEYGDIIREFTTTSNSTFRVFFAAKELVDVLQQHPPKGIIVVHNHPSGSAHPSIADIEFTKFLHVFCDAEDIRLLDHFIYTESGKMFSFKDDKRLSNLPDGKRMNYRMLFQMAERLRRF